MGDDQRALLESFVVLRAQTGDESAFEELYERYNDRLLYYLRRIVGRSGLAEDTAQGVWITVYRKVKTLEKPGAFRSWLYRIAHNRAINALRRVGKEVSWDADDGDSRVGRRASAALEAAADEAADTAEFDRFDASVVHAGLDAISEPHREVLTLRFLHDMSYQEIADVTDVGLGTIRSRLHHAKNALRSELETTHGRELKGVSR